VNALIKASCYACYKCYNSAASSIYDFTVKNIDENEVALSTYKYFKTLKK
jgi:hypothetical protein